MLSSLFFPNVFLPIQIKHLQERLFNGRVGPIGFLTFFFKISQVVVELDPLFVCRLNFVRSLLFLLHFIVIQIVVSSFP